MNKSKQNFGGRWTAEKLTILENYLTEYSKIMNKSHFKFAYIDAFAGSGYYKEISKDTLSLFDDPVGKAEKLFLEGSTAIALNVKPPFKKYIFIEKDQKRFNELKTIKDQHEDKDISVENREANEYLSEICSMNWTKHRAVIFLDPFGMQIKWSTLEKIAATKAIDLWFLFPLGQAVNRLLKKDGTLKEKNAKRLDEIFGTREWYPSFYKEYIDLDLFSGKTKKLKKNADFKAISYYFVERLDTIFEAVITNPKPLMNSTNVPLFLLCFAAANEKGAPIAIRIAKYILDKT